MYMLLTA